MLPLLLVPLLASIRVEAEKRLLEHAAARGEHHRHVRRDGVGRLIVQAHAPFDSAQLDEQGQKRAVAGRKPGDAARVGCELHALARRSAGRWAGWSPQRAWAHDP